MKYSLELGLEAYHIIIESAVSNIELCKMLGISPSTFYSWLDKGGKEYKKEFAAFIEYARGISKEIRIQEALAALRKASLGYEYTETHTEYKDNVEVKKVVRIKNRPPNIKAINGLLAESRRIF